MSMDIIINTLERNTANGAVITVHWSTVKTQGEHAASQYGTESFDADPAAPGFVPYEQLTKAIVTGWLTERWGAEGLAAKEAALDAHLAELAAPAVTTGLPWTA
jgi:hypothetical protein